MKREDITLFIKKRSDDIRYADMLIRHHAEEEKNIVIVSDNNWYEYGKSRKEDVYCMRDYHSLCGKDIDILVIWDIDASGDQIRNNYFARLHSSSKVIIYKLKRRKEYGTS